MIEGDKLDIKRSTTTKLSARDRRFLDRAVELARRGWGRVNPNPMVGCVLVREGEIVGEGWHAVYGGPHAEVVALSEAGERAKGATAYVTLEPCRHEGKTPPCSEALSDAGVRRVVFGAVDPGKTSGGGGSVLTDRGVEVIGPVFTEREALRQNPAFFSGGTGRLWTALKLAVSLDGKISSGAGVRTQISGPEADEEVHRLRAGFDAILIGTNTALTDDPLLTVRGDVTPRTPPRRVILDAEGKVSPEAKVLREGEGPVDLLTTAASPEDWRAEVRANGGRVTEVAHGRNGGVSLAAAMDALRTFGVQTLLCEGGGLVGMELLQEKMVDRLYLIVAPTLIGPDGVSAFPRAALSRSSADERSDPRWASAWRHWAFIEEPRRLGSDVWMVLEPREE